MRWLCALILAAAAAGVIGTIPSTPCVESSKSSDWKWSRHSRVIFSSSPILRSLPSGAVDDVDTIDCSTPWISRDMRYTYRAATGLPYCPPALAS